MAITFTNTSPRPDDGSAQGGSAASPMLLSQAGAVTGSLVVISAQYRGAPTSIDMDETGGQTWTPLTAVNDAGNLCAVRWFWTRWDNAVYNGLNPAIFVTGGSSTIALTTVGMIFQPTAPNYLWAIDNAFASTQYAAPSTPFTVTRTGVTTTKASTVAIAGWYSEDDNTWGTLTGAGWTNAGATAQYRNTTGNDMSCSFAYLVQSTAGATGNVSKQQTALGGDAGLNCIASFYEYAVVSRNLNINQAVNRANTF